MTYHVDVTLSDRFVLRSPSVPISNHANSTEWHVQFTRQLRLRNLRHPYHMTSPLSVHLTLHRNGGSVLLMFYQLFAFVISWTCLNHVDNGLMSLDKFLTQYKFVRLQLCFAIAWFGTLRGFSPQTLAFLHAYGREVRSYHTYRDLK